MHSSLDETISLLPLHPAKLLIMLAASCRMLSESNVELCVAGLPPDPYNIRHREIQHERNLTILEGIVNWELIARSLSTLSSISAFGKCEVDQFVPLMKSGWYLSRCNCSQSLFSLSLFLSQPQW